ncbi:MAG: hypothetical protein LBK95_19995 [Bifidobacteriaceae bacterium]|jgi:hypothetical protein|nr:hypothetical protein [Bifidobacteriaceae bacterium]
MKHMTTTSSTSTSPVRERRAGEELPPGMFHGGEEVPEGTFHGGEEVPEGTFHAALVQCPKCKHWFASDTYAWRVHHRSCRG